MKEAEGKHTNFMKEKVLEVGTLFFVTRKSSYIQISLLYSEYKLPAQLRRMLLVLHCV